jgi:cell division protein FtsW
MNKTLSNIFKGDKVIWMVFFFLCIISIVEVYSASSELTYKSSSYLSPVLKHIGVLILGVFCMLVTLNIKCKYFKLITPFLLIIAFISLLWVLVAGQTTNGAQRWISLLGMQFQPSEIAKGTMVLATAQILSAMQTDKGADRNAMKYVLVISLFIIPLILLENFSTAFLLCVVIFLMMFIGRVPLKQLGSLLGIVMLLAFIAVGTVMLVGTDRSKVNTKLNLTEQSASNEKNGGGLSSVFHRADTWKSRIDQFMDKKEVAPKDVDLINKDAQVSHANIAIASSNVVGKGPGRSDERDFLSQAFSDFIYAIIIEETGIEGAFLVAFLYVILFVRAGMIAKRCDNNFPAFLAMGLSMLLVVQALFNMCVAVGWLPVTGQPLPLISKGGTSTMINCIYVGAILSVSRSAKKRPVEVGGAVEGNSEMQPSMA